MSLTLRSLPALLTDCVLVGHARKADVVFTPRQWFAMCIHMLNENPATFFLMPYRDKDGTPKFSKAFRADAHKRMQWVWDTITGNAKFPASIGFYPTNPQRQSRWAAIDFDAHDGNAARARDFALKAFAILYQQPQLFVCLATSAGDAEHSGFHLFLFSLEFLLCEDWTRLLKQVCAQIGAEIRPGVCEIFPDEFRGPRSIGKAIRAPATWNPKTGDCGLVLHENLTQSFLPSLPCGIERDGIALSVLCELPRVKGASSQSSGVFRGEHGEWQKQFAITAPSTRHKRLTELVGTGLFQAGREVVRKNAEIQYREATPTPKASEREHLEEFDKAWLGWEREWFAGLSAAERQKYEALTTQHEREGFRIIRNWSQIANAGEFKIRCQSLGDRLGMSLGGACKLRRRFCEAGILQQTKPHVPNKFCGRFKWIASAERKREQAALITPTQWNGDPGDVRSKRLYRLLGLNVIEKTERAYKSLCGHLSRWRKAGEVAWNAFSDSTRWHIKPPMFDGIADALKRTQETYRRDLWATQPSYVEVWVEKDAIAGVIDDVTASFGVPLFVCRGFASLSSMYSASLQFKAAQRNGKEVTIFHLGDYDPSGHAAADAIERTFRETFDCGVNFERIAILPEHIEQFSLPTRPTKQSDSRARNWRGSECVELDSMPPAQLRGLVQGAITSLIDSYEWEKLKEIEQEELATFSATIAGFTASDDRDDDDDLLIPF